jgi:glutamate-5-semialdehyde dehydrogenase
MDKYIKNLLINAKKDSSSIANVSSLSKNEFLLHLEKQLMSNKKKLLVKTKKI